MYTRIWGKVAFVGNFQPGEIHSERNRSNSPSLSLSVLNVAHSAPGGWRVRANCCSIQITYANMLRSRATKSERFEKNGKERSRRATVSSSLVLRCIKTNELAHKQCCIARGIDLLSRLNRAGAWNRLC